MFTALRYTFRTLLKTPGFTATALATLALCLGANLTIFAVVDAILIRPLPFPESNRLVTLYYVYPHLASATPGASLTNYYERRGKIPALSSIAEIAEGNSVVGETGATSLENLGRVTPEFFATLAVQPFMGRAFTDAEMTYNTDSVAMISYEYWQSHFAADPNVLGKPLRLDGLSRTIVGVLPPGFRFLSFEAPIYMPLSSEEGERNIGARHSIGKILIGRLAPNATLAEARAQTEALDTVLAPAFLDAKIITDAGCHTIVASLHDDYVAPARPTLLLLQAGAFLLLVIGGVNLVNLLLIRASGRSREFAIRQALGAAQGRVAQEVLTETLLLTLIGSLLGIGLSVIGLKLLTLFGAAQLPLGSQIGFNVRLVVVASLGSLLSGIALGLPVIWFNLRARLAVVLQGESRGNTTGRGVHRLRHVFIVAQVALAFVLLTGAGLLGLSLKRAMEVSPGFRADHVITGQFNLTWNGYHDLPSFRGFFERLYAKTRALPGVTATGVISNIPVVGARDNDAFTVPGYTPKSGESAMVHDFYGLAGDYFAAMGIPLRAGRWLNQADTNRNDPVCVVDEVFARHYWPTGDAVGKQVYRGTSNSIGKNQTPFTIVGVVGAIKQAGLTDRQARGAIYMPYNLVFFRNFFVVARTSLPADSLALTLARTVRAVDPDVPLTDLQTMEVRIDNSLATRRSPTLLAGVFAATALLLAIIGLYGVMAYSVARRTNEFGVRMALGAQRRDVLRLVFGQGARLTVIGLIAGLLGSLFLTGSMSSLLFEVKPDNPLNLIGVALLLSSVAALACLLPARRATKVDPMVALRAE
ncbi:MAG TPA: ABC transporter permease [Lacunisphaera sp.]|jgi:predicted permease